MPIFLLLVSLNLIFSQNRNALPWHGLSVSLSDNTDALDLNPAGLGVYRGEQFAFNIQQSENIDNNNENVFTATIVQRFNSGFAFQHQYDEINKYRWSIGYGLKVNKNKWKKHRKKLKETVQSYNKLKFSKDPKTLLSQIKQAKKDYKSIKNEIKNYETQLENIGTVNYLAKEDFETLNSRHEEITGNIEDLNLAKKELNSHINEIENEISFRIESSFNSISVHFSEIFETLFPGGKGSLSFTDKENILETGIDISVQPKGKKVKKLSLLSGGERSLAAIAFLFSIFKSFPSPFYILDEVEAALDDANLHRMINLLKHVKGDAQYIIVTHQQQTMHAGDVLYGVTMEPGSGSRVFTKTKADFEELINKS